MAMLGTLWVNAYLCTQEIGPEAFTVFFAYEALVKGIQKKLASILLETHLEICDKDFLG